MAGMRIVNIAGPDVNGTRRPLWAGESSFPVAFIKLCAMRFDEGIRYKYLFRF